MDMQFRVIPKQMFFDRAEVIGAMKDKTRRVLNYFGGLTRTIAKRSMRKRKGVSAPGSPPSAHAGDLRRHIYYGYDRSRESVVVGALAYAAGRGDAVFPLGGETVPSLHETGGAARIGKRRATYAPRPFMGPAADEALDKLPQQWARN